MSVFYDNYVRLCALNNLSESGAAKKIGLSNAAANGWKNGKMPSATTQIKLAKLFGISPGELMGAPSIPPQDAKKAPTEISERELDMSLIKRLVQLTPDEKEKVDAFVQGLLASRQE